MTDDPAALTSWEPISNRLQQMLNAGTFATWFGNAQPLEQDDARLVIGVPNEFTKNWIEGWLAKLRADQRAAKADIAVIVSQARCPRAQNDIDLVDGVWVSAPRCAIAIAVVLRESLIGIANAWIAGEGQQTKAEMVYQFLTGPRFRHYVVAIVEKAVETLSDLDRQRRTMTRLWAKQEEQIRGVIKSIAGMYGDLQGIAGRTLQEIESLQIPLIESSTGQGQAEPSTKTNGGAYVEQQRHPGRRCRDD